MDSEFSEFFFGIISCVVALIIFGMGSCTTYISYRDDIKKEKAIYFEDVEYRCKKEPTK